MLLNEGGDTGIMLGHLEHFEEYQNYHMHNNRRGKGCPQDEKRQAVGPDEIPTKLWRCSSKDGVKWLTRIFNVILKTIKELAS